MKNPERKVGLVQINNSFSGQNYFPLSVGMLQAYAEKYFGDAGGYVFLPPIYSRINVDESVERLSEADIVGFSTYVWNFNISLAIAKQLKQRKPDIVIAFGGPHVPDRIQRRMAREAMLALREGTAAALDTSEFDTGRVEAYLRRYPFIDIACHGEGEKLFTTFLENAFGDWRNVPSVSFIDNHGQFVQTPRLPRIQGLDELPSPYLEGTFEVLMKENPDQRWIVMWETNRGCPFSCAFCDWGSAVASKLSKWDITRLYREVDWFADHEIKFIFCADANFGILPRDLELAAYLAKVKGARGYPEYISIQATKNAQERSYQAQKMLADARMNGAVVLSMQSLYEPTLKAIKRDNISLDVYKALQVKFAAGGIETVTDLILGLPEETYESWIQGIDTLLNHGQHNRIQFNNLSILPNAEMGDPEYQKFYGMETVVSEVVNFHGSLPDKNEIVEHQELVIATHAMPRADWVRTRAFSWMVGFLHFDKILQIPIIAVHRVAGIPYRELLEFFSEGASGAFRGTEAFPILDEVRQFFLEKARDIQDGGVEFCHAPEWLNIYWPADEYIFIKLCVERKLKAFYEEAERALRLLLESKSVDFDNRLLHDAITLNYHLIKLPFQTTDINLSLSYNIFELYRSVILRCPMELKQRPHLHHINRTAEQWTSWEEWYEKVVWYGNKKGAYLYGNTTDEPQREGHF